MHEPKVAKLQKKLTSPEFSEWIAFMSLKNQEADPNTPKQQSAAEMKAKFDAVLALAAAKQKADKARKEVQAKEKGKAK